MYMHSSVLLFLVLDRRIEKEDLNSYLGKKREMFLMQVCQPD